MDARKRRKAMALHAAGMPCSMIDTIIEVPDGATRREMVRLWAEDKEDAVRDCVMSLDTFALEGIIVEHGHWVPCSAIDERYGYEPGTARAVIVRHWREDRDE